MANKFAVTRRGYIIATFATKAEAIAVVVQQGGIVCGLNQKNQWVRFKVQSR